MKPGILTTEFWLTKCVVGITGYCSWAYFAEPATIERTAAYLAIVFVMAVCVMGYCQGRLDAKGQPKQEQEPDGEGRPQMPPSREMLGFGRYVQEAREEGFEE